MIRYFEDYVDRMLTMHNDYKKTISGLSVEALDWVPGPDMNSLTVMIVHATAVERFMVGDMVALIPSNRVRADEFLAKGMDEAALVARLDDTLVFVRETVSKLTLEDLVAIRELPKLSAGASKPPTTMETLTVGWALMQALMHAALHLGHAQITRQLWDQQHPQ